jgi:hypothetical protein
VADTQGGVTPSFAGAVAAAKAEIAKANAITDASLEDVAVPEAVTVVDQATPDTLEHAPSFADAAKEAVEPFMFEDVAEQLLKPNPFSQGAEDKSVLDEFVAVEGSDAPVQVSELVNGYLRQADYTRKTQALAEQRKAFQAESEATSKLMDALRENPAGTIASLAISVGLIEESDLSVDVISKINQAHKVPSREEVEQQVAARAQALVDADPRIQEAEDQKLMAQVQESFKGIEDVHGITLSDRDKEAILQQAVEMGTMRLDLAYLDLKTRADKLRADRKIAAQGAPQAAAVAGGDGGAVDTAVVKTKPKSIAEAWALTKSAQ